ncbi:hypothetical protein VPH35_021811 [Triticum aestivum]
MAADPPTAGRLSFKHGWMDSGRYPSSLGGASCRSRPALRNRPSPPPPRRRRWGSRLHQTRAPPHPTDRKGKKQHEVPVCIKLLSLIFWLCPLQVDYLIGRAKCNRRSSSAATRQTPSKKDLPLSLLMVNYHGTYLMRFVKFYQSGGYSIPRFMIWHKFHLGNLVLGTLIYNDTPKQAKKPKEVKCFYLLLASDEQLQVSTIVLLYEVRVACAYLKLILIICLPNCG